MIARDPKKTGPLYTLAAAKVKPAAGLSKTDVDEIIAKFGPNAAARMAEQVPGALALGERL